MPNYENPYNGQSPIMGPLLRAQQFYNIAQENQRQQQAMDLQRQQFDANQQQRQLDNTFRQNEFDYQKGNTDYNRKHQEENEAYARSRSEDTEKYNRSNDAFTRTLQMAQLGAVPGNPQGQTVFNRVFGTPTDPRAAVQTPEGQTYYLPTERERLAKKYQDVINMGKLDAANAYYKMNMIFPVDSAMRRNTMPPHLFQGTDAEGNLNYIGVDPTTGQVVFSGKQPGFGAAKKGTDMATQAEGERARVQGLIDKARHNDALVQTLRGSQNLTSRQSTLLAKSVADSQYLWDEALRAANNAVKKYPQHLRGGAGEGGYAWIGSVSPEESAGQSAAPPMRYPLNWGPQR